MWKKLKENIFKLFHQFTGHNIKCITKMEYFMEFMYKPVDGASLGVGRMLFGFMMLIDIPEERGGSELDFRWGEPTICSFPLFSFLQPLSLPYMGILYAIMWFGAIGITLGYKFRLACLMFVVPYWFIFLLDISIWNNHSYLFGLCGIIFLFSNANRYCAIDALQNPKTHQMIPFWNYFLIKYQFFILYTLAGIKKLSSEWLSGYALTNLGYHWVFSPFRFLIGSQLTDLLIVHWFGCVFDITIAFWLIYRKTRPVATIFAVAFHFMNSRLFSIGMFPWVCVLELPLFYNNNWPRNLLEKYFFKTPLKNNVNIKNDNDSNSCGENKFIEAQFCSVQETTNNENSNINKITKRKKATVYLILFYCFLQLFLPYSHFITKGYNNWTDGIYGYSWDMMIHAWDTVQVTVRIVDNGNDKSHFIEPYAFTENDRWTKHADMAKQHATCINKYLQYEYYLNLHNNNNNNLLTSDNYSIYFDVWCSLNGRFQQRMYNPTVDILKADWSPFYETKWIMPLLKEFTKMRTTISQITDDILSLNNYTDVLFIADFPTFILDNYISPELENVTLTVLEGSVRYESDTGLKIDHIQKQSINIESGIIHKIITISKTPSCYMYTYVNKTMQLLQESETEPMPVKSKAKLPLIAEFLHRIENYKQFLANIANSFLFIIYKVPMPVRLK